MDLTNWKNWIDPPMAGEEPLDHPVANGGYCGIFRRVGCVGDSLSSGEFEAHNEEGTKLYIDLYDYSWGQYLARAAGIGQVYNFSRGGMTAKEYLESFAEANGFWDPEKACQAYIVALGVNDVINKGMAVGSTADIAADWRENEPTFAGYYAQIIERLKEISPDAKFFFVTMPKNDTDSPERIALRDAHAELLYELAEYFSNAYVINLRRYAPVYDAAFRKKFYMGNHLNPMGYVLTAEMMASYIDYIIRTHPADFRETGFIGTPYRNGRPQE